MTNSHLVPQTLLALAIVLALSAYLAYVAYFRRPASPDAPQGPAKPPVANLRLKVLLVALVVCHALQGPTGAVIISCLGQLAGPVAGLGGAATALVPL